MRKICNISKYRADLSSSAEEIKFKKQRNMSYSNLDSGKYLTILKYNILKSVYEVCKIHFYTF